ncbi:hypothetical protein [Clostridium sp. C8-1-8]|uniref:hypothetical protein n=1 Tax=Clostridium sp. C8-1-8 TaxID=2698831 RepID=UPI001367EA0B|nr:hypothetical protein [Clostridium sp. C8-1-8]
MKQKYIYVITVLILSVICIFFYYHSRSSILYERIDVYAAKDFDKSTQYPILSIADNNGLGEVANILRESKKMSGVLNVSSPDYILEMHSNDKSINTVYLWIKAASIQGMYIYKDNTETGYAISKSDTEKLKKIILTSRK